MTTNSVTITVPNRLYQRLARVAEETERDVSDVLLASAEAMLTVEAANEALPANIVDELTAMQWFSDTALWEATHPTLSEQQQATLSKLSRQQAERPLNEVEQTQMTQLLAEYDRSVLRRAQALALLSLRGHHLADLNAA